MRCLDGLVGLAALCLLVGVYAAPRAYLWWSPEADNRTRWFWDVQGFDEVTWQVPSQVLWVGADERPLPPGRMAYMDTDGLLPPYASTPLQPGPGRLLAYRTPANLPGDRWGSPWYLVVEDTGTYPGRERGVFSPGPNRRFDWGRGDDQGVDGVGMFYTDRTWSYLGRWALLIAVPWVVLRLCLRLPTRRPAAEIVQCGLLAAGLALGLHLTLRRDLAWLLGGLVPQQVVVSIPLAVALSLATLFWGVLLGLRLTSPREEGPSAPGDGGAA